MNIIDITAVFTGNLNRSTEMSLSHNYLGVFSRSFDVITTVTKNENVEVNF